MTHELRETIATLLFKADHSDSSDLLRTRHRGPLSLQSYQHLRERLKICQQHDILFQTDVKERKSKISNLLFKADIIFPSNAIGKASDSRNAFSDASEKASGE